MLTTNTKFQKKWTEKNKSPVVPISKIAGMQIKVPFRDIAIIIIICNRESFIWLKFHARIFVILAHFADNLAHPYINLCSGSPAKNNSCSYQIKVEPTALSLKWLFLWKPVLFGGSIGFDRGVSTCMSNSECCFLGGFVWKNRGPQDSLKKSKNNYSKGVVYNPWEVRSPLEILSRTGQKTPARGLLTTLWNWESFEVHLEFCQQAKAACILAFAPSTDDIQDGKSRYQAHLQFLKFLTPDWWIFATQR